MAPSAGAAVSSMPGIWTVGRCTSGGGASGLTAITPTLAIATPAENTERIAADIFHTPFSQDCPGYLNHRLITGSAKVFSALRLDWGQPGKVAGREHLGCDPPGNLRREHLNSCLESAIVSCQPTS